MRGAHPRAWHSAGVLTGRKFDRSFNESDPFNGTSRCLGLFEMPTELTHEVLHDFLHYVCLRSTVVSRTTYSWQCVLLMGRQGSHRSRL